MTTLLSFFIVLGILIFVHELGHFILAKKSGVGVLKFSLGFGPKIVGYKKDETEYLISMLPLGGYVKMIGEETNEEIKNEDREKSFANKPVSSRAAIVFAGPLMNLALALILFPVIYIIGIHVPAYIDKQPVIGYVFKDSPAHKADIKQGDIIISIDGKEVKTWEVFESMILSNPNNALKVEIKRDGNIIGKELLPSSSKHTGAGVSGILPPMSPTVGDVKSGYPAEKGGLKIGDTIISIDGINTAHWAEIQEILQSGGGKEKEVAIKRGDSVLTFTIKPRLNEDAGTYIIGISPKQDIITKRYGPVDAVVIGTKKMIDMTIFTFVIIKKLFVGEVSIKTLGGPLMIAQIAGQAAESGLTAFLSLMAALSLQLGILNLLPIPVLDGGHLLFFGIEKLRGKPLNAKVMEIAQHVGIALLIVLMVFVTYNDIWRLLDR
ncbi:MAG: RIP metalloprotease RseP [Deltaproteobacteria bacterium GWC2_42_11]|nr:MAG: RIP metalloprotease RseP [Deltaproteobacteria bacterium GWC2_42_11]HBO84592.1 RIP metalloprotease RseP [Deltaproteobacteria bacterium]